jgi:acyl-CoA synthetase (NDP forming)
MTSFRAGTGAVCRPADDGLGPLFDPVSIAVVGASENPAKWGYWLASGALAGAARRTVHLVNRRGGTLLGEPFLPALGALPAVAEHVVVAVPPEYVRQVVREGLELGSRFFTVITAGGTDADDERALAREITSRGARLLGPNCMGVVDTTTELRLSWGDFPTGGMGLVSQSGSLALEIGRMLDRAGEGFSRVVSLGNQRDIDAADALGALVKHEQTRVIGAYVEDFKDGRRLAGALAAARAAGKPVLLLTVGRSTASGRAAASHTGALVSEHATVAAMCRDTGALLLDTAGELVDFATYLLAGHTRRTTAPAAAGRLHRIAVVGDSGGQGGLAADTLTAAGLEVPSLSARTERAVGVHLTAAADCGNPVDLAGSGEADLSTYARVSGELLRSGDVDAVLLTGYFGDYTRANPAQLVEESEVAHALADASAETGRPLVVHTMARDTPALAVLRRRGIPVYERIEQAAGALAHAARLLRPPEPLTPVPAPAGRPLVDAHYASARELLASYGVTFPVAEFVATAEEAVAAAELVGYPLALKAMGLAHKTEAGGVALGVAEETALRVAFARMEKATGAVSFTVEAMATPQHAHELIVGVRRDVSFGPVVMVGMGGVTAELVPDTVVAFAPLTTEHAGELLRELRHAALLGGWRGAPGIHTEAAAAAVCAVALAAAEHPELTELEVNPLLVHPGGAIALDAHGVLSAQDTGVGF